MNPIKWLLWKICQRLWDLAYRFHKDTLLYYSTLGLIEFSPVFNEKEEVKMC